MYNNLDDDGNEVCPYDGSHRVKPTRFQKHLIICGKQHPEMQLARCFFNWSHMVPYGQCEEHLRICPNTNYRTLLIISEMRKFPYTPTEPVIEDWGDERSVVSQERNLSLKSSDEITKTTLDFISESTFQRLSRYSTKPSESSNDGFPRGWENQLAADSDSYAMGPPQELKADTESEIKIPSSASRYSAMRRKPSQNFQLAQKRDENSSEYSDSVISSPPTATTTYSQPLTIAALQAHDSYFMNNPEWQANSLPMHKNYFPNSVQDSDVSIITTDTATANKLASLQQQQTLKLVGGHVSIARHSAALGKKNRLQIPGADNAHFVCDGDKIKVSYGESSRMSYATSEASFYTAKNGDE